MRIYENLKAIDGIYVFEETNRLFYIVQVSRYSEEQLRDSMPVFQEKVDKALGITNTVIQVVDLNQKCSPNEIIVEGQTGKLKRKKYDDVRCFICQ